MRERWLNICFKVIVYDFSRIRCPHTKSTMQTSCLKDGGQCLTSLVACSWLVQRAGSWMLLRTLYLLGRLKEAVLKMYLFKTEATKNINFSNTTNVFFLKHAITNIFVGNTPLQMYSLETGHYKCICWAGNVRYAGLARGQDWCPRSAYNSLSLFCTLRLLNSQGQKTPSLWNMTAQCSANVFNSGGKRHTGPR